MAGNAVLKVDILVDAAKAAAGMGKAEQSVGKFQKGLSKAVVPAGLALGAVLAFGKGAADAASATQQAFGGIDAVFGSSAAQMKTWATAAADSAGLAASQYGDLATIIGSQLKNAGTPLDQVATKTDTLIKLGADLAATYGGTTAEAVGALSSALKGEMDPLERYGTSLSQAAVSAQMAADHTDKLTGKQAAAAKQAATLELITRQTTDAQGKFASEADTVAGQQARATAAWENAQSTLGTSLLPTLTKITGILTTVATAVGHHPALFMAFAAAIAAVAAAVLILNTAMTIYTAVTTLAGSATVVAWAAALWPILAIIAAVGLVVGIIVLLWKKSETFRNVTLAVWGAIKAAAAAVWSFLKAAGGAVFTVLKLYFTVYKAVAVAVFNAIKAAAAAVWNAIKAGAAAIANSPQWAILKRVGSAAINALLAPAEAVKSAFEAVLGVVQDIIDWIGRIKFPSPPSWLPGVGKAAPASAAVAAPRAAASPLLGRTTQLAGAGGSSSVVINVNGVIDGADAARKIRQILRDDDRRTRGVLIRRG